MLKWLEIIVRTIVSTLCTQRSLAIENLVLRQQLAVLKHRHPRPRLTDTDRFFWVVLSRIWAGWRESLHIVQPETVVRWHRLQVHDQAMWAAFPDVADVSGKSCQRHHCAGFLHSANSHLPDALCPAHSEPRSAADTALRQNPYAERVIGSIRRECLDHIIILNERHLKRVLSSYVTYYHGARTHLSLAKDAPDGREVQAIENGSVVELKRVGGVHHLYTRVAA